MTRSESVRRLLLVGGVVAACVAAASIATASVPDASATYTACYKTSGSPRGALRIIDPSAGQKCVTGEKKITWQKGGIRYRGAYSATATYAVNDIVTSGGGSYLARRANKGVPVSNTTNWGVLATRGARGARGPAGPAGPKGFASGVSFTIADTENYKAVTPTFVASADMTCFVTTSAQVTASTAAPAGAYGGYVRNAVFVNGGSGANDGQYGLYIVSNGLTGPQPAISRSSVIAVTKGSTIAFGAYYASPPAPWVGSYIYVTTSYACS